MEAADASRKTRRHHQRSCAADLHIGDNRTAEGSQHQSPACPELGRLFAGLTGASPEDRLYDCLPLFHSVGGIVAPCSMLTAGASVVLSDKFSAGHFWQDIVRWDCTLFQYIGELCRYLLKAPASEYETNISFGWPAATVCAAISGKRFRRASPFLKYSNFMRRPKAISRFTTWRAGRVRSAGFRRCWRIVFSGDHSS